MLVTSTAQQPFQPVGRVALDGHGDVTGAVERHADVGGGLIFVVRRPLVGREAGHLATACARLRLLPFPRPVAQAFDQVVILGVRKRLAQTDSERRACLIRAAGERSTLVLATTIIAGQGRARTIPLASTCRGCGQ